MGVPARMRVISLSNSLRKQREGEAKPRMTKSGFNQIKPPFGKTLAALGRSNGAWSGIVKSWRAPQSRSFARGNRRIFAEGNADYDWRSNKHGANVITAPRKSHRLLRTNANLGGVAALREKPSRRFRY